MSIQIQHCWWHCVSNWYYTNNPHTQRRIKHNFTRTVSWATCGSVCVERCRTQTWTDGLNILYVWTLSRSHFHHRHAELWETNQARVFCTHYNRNFRPECAWLQVSSVERPGEPEHLIGLLTIYAQFTAFFSTRWPPSVFTPQKCDYLIIQKPLHLQ